MAQTRTSAQDPDQGVIALMPETSAPPEPALKKGTGRALISAERIAKRVEDMGREISEVYAEIDTPLVLVVILDRKSVV